MKAAEKFSFVSAFGFNSKGSVSDDKKSVFYILYSIFCLLSFGLYGCSVGQYFHRQKLPYEKLSASYNQVRLKTSASLDVLQIVGASEADLGPRFKGRHLLSQNDTAIASTGQNKNGYKSWVTLIAFDEKSMVARRKYFYLVEEKAWVKPGLIFDSQMVLPFELLDKLYKNDEEKQIAILNQVAEDFGKDVAQLSQDNKMLEVCGMLMNQVFKTVFLELDKSPTLAKSIGGPNGVEFDHMNFGKGRICMTVDGNIVTSKIRLGSFRKRIEAESTDHLLAEGSTEFMY
jgi:hypothetical protein